MPGMCNDFGNRVPYDEYLRAFSQIRAPLRWPEAAPNLEPRDDIWPTDLAPVIWRSEDGEELVQFVGAFPRPGRRVRPLSISAPKAGGFRTAAA